jgi:hypothetical protein
MNSALVKLKAVDFWRYKIYDIAPPSRTTT